MNLDSGTRVGRFVVARELGRGGSGTVYEVVHDVLGVRRALKLLHTRDPVAVDRLLTEGRIQATIDHPNVVRVVDTLRWDDMPALVMELVEGPSLHTLLRQVRLSPEDGLRLFRGIVAGVAVAHRAGVVHRDLKPANVLLDTQVSPAIARVTDFGVARLLDGDAQRTETGVRIGTIAYMSPEQLRGGRGDDPRSDVFSLGLLLHRLVVGTPAFAVDGDVVERVKLIEAGPPTPSRPVPRAVYDCLRLCLAADPALRPADAGEVLALLDGSSAAAPRTTRRYGRSVLGGVALAVAGSLVGATGVAFFGSADSAAVTGSDNEALALLLAAERERPAEALALARAASTLGVPLDAGRVSDWLRRGAAQLRFHTDSEAVSVALDAGRVGAADRAGVVTVWDRGSGSQTARVDTGVEQPRGLTLLGDAFALFPDQRLGRHPGRTLLWGLPGGDSVLESSGLIESGLASDGGRWIAAATVDGVQRRVSLWDGHALEQRWSRDAEEGMPALATAAGVVAVPKPNDAMDLIDPEGRTLRSMAASSLSTRVAPLGTRVTFVGADHRLRFVELSSGQVSRGAVIPRQFRFDVSEEVGLAAARGGREVHVVRGDSSHVEAIDGSVSVVVASAGGFLVGTAEGAAVPFTVSGAPGGMLQASASPVTALAEHNGVAASQLSGAVNVWSPAADHQGPESVWNAAGTAYLALDGTAIEWRDGVLYAADVELAQLPEPPLAAPVPPSAPGRPWTITSRTEVRHGDLVVATPIGQADPHPLVAVGDRVAVVTRDLVLVPDAPPIRMPRVWAKARLGARLAVLHGDPVQVSVIDVAEARVIRTVRLGTEDHRAASVAIPAADGGVLVGTWDGALLHLDAEGVQQATYRTHTSAVVDVALVGASIVSLSQTGTVRSAGEPEWEVDLGHTASRMAVSPSGRIAVAGSTGALAVVDGGRVTARRRVSGRVTGLAWRGESLAALVDGQVFTWTREQLAAPLTDPLWLGRLSNLRVCRDSARVVAVVPFPAPDTVWAPEHACGS